MGVCPSKTTAAQYIVPYLQDVDRGIGLWPGRSEANGRVSKTPPRVDGMEATQVPPVCDGHIAITSFMALPSLSLRTLLLFPIALFVLASWSKR